MSEKTQEERDLAVTLEHVGIVINWLKQERVGEEALSDHAFDMSIWGSQEGDTVYCDEHNYDCRTAACLWGTSYFLVHGDLPEGGPCVEWRSQSKTHNLIHDLMLGQGINSLNDDQQVVDAYEAIVQEEK